MPFDDTTHTYTPAKLPVEVHIIDRMLASFGANGEYWIQGRFVDGFGGKCLMGALLASPQDGSKQLSVLHNLLNQQRLKSPTDLTRWNDDRFRKFSEVKDMLLNARQELMREKIS